MIWYAANGQVIKRIGDFAKVNRVNAAPKPGPPTPQSRAAQRDPSTPNRVWVTPSVGTPHTTFKVHFRILLNDADYHYQFTGARCPRYTFPGGTGKPNALRGGLWSDPLLRRHRPSAVPRHLPRRGQRDGPRPVWEPQTHSQTLRSRDIHRPTLNRPTHRREAGTRCHPGALSPALASASAGAL